MAVFGMESLAGNLECMDFASIADRMELEKVMPELGMETRGMGMELESDVVGMENRDLMMELEAELSEVKGSKVTSDPGTYKRQKHSNSESNSDINTLKYNSWGKATLVSLLYDKIFCFCLTSRH